ncbi:MAG: HEAT repeat domain-containing protein [Akkermansiaceae bacterium]
MKFFRKYHLAPLMLGLALSEQVLSGESVQEAIAKVEERAPGSFPEIYMSIPEPALMKAVSVGDLVAGLDTWNPSIRTAISKELAVRFRTEPTKLYAMAVSKNANVRSGVVMAISELASWMRKDWKTAFPETTNYREAQALLAADEMLAQVLTKAARDSELDVQNAALKGLSLLGAESDDVVLALIELTASEDVYVAQMAMESLGKAYTARVAELPNAIAPLKKALGSPLPRGRGFVVSIIEKMDEDLQRQFIPELVAHLEWTPDRDTMFGAGGQISAVKILTALKAKELIPLIPNLVNKTVRGSDLLPVCMESCRAFGKDAKVILPELRQLADALSPTEDQLKARDGKRLSDRYKAVTETIDFLEKI